MSPTRLPLIHEILPTAILLTKSSGAATMMWDIIFWLKKTVGAVAMAFAVLLALFAAG